MVYEKTRSLGGHALVAGRLPGRENIRAIVQWQIDRLKDLKVEVKYGLEVTGEADVIEFILREEEPDAVVIAAGSSAIRSGFQPYTMHDVGWVGAARASRPIRTSGTGRSGWASVIIADTLSFIEAPGLAEHLARQGSDVEIVTPLRQHRHGDEPLQPLGPSLAQGIRGRCRDNPVHLGEEVEGRAVTLYNVYRPQDERVEEVDNLVLITGSIQNDSLPGRLQGPREGGPPRGRRTDR